MPVATIEEVAPLPDLLSRNTGFRPQEVLDAALRRSTLSMVSGARARVFHPIVHGHEGALLSESALIIRSGRFSTKLTVVPYSNIQGVSLDQGILQPPLRLGNVTVFGAQEIKSATVRNLDADGATAPFELLRTISSVPPVKGTPTQGNEFLALLQ